MSRISAMAVLVTSRQRLARLGVGGGLFAAAACVLVLWAGLQSWQRWEANRPLRAIRSVRPSERRAAAEELAQRPDIDPDSARAALIDALADEATVVRVAAARSLATVISGSPDRLADRARLKGRVEAANRGLVPLLSDPDPDVRFAAAFALGSMGRMPLSGSPLPTKDVGLFEAANVARRKAAATEYRLPDLPLPPQLTAALQDSSPAVRTAAARAIARFGPDLDPVIPALFAAIEKAGKDEGFRDACHEAVNAAWPGAALAPFLIRSLASRDRQVRFHAVELLGLLGPEAPEALPLLIAVLNEPFDPEEWKRSEAAGIIGLDPTWPAAAALGLRSGDRRAVAALVAAIAPENFERYTRSVIRVQPLTTEVPGLAEKEGSRMLGVLHAIEDVGPPAVAAVPSLIWAHRRAIETTNSIGANRIPRALGRVAPNTPAAPDAVAALIRALDEKDYWRSQWRQGAVEALGHFGKDAAAAVPRLRAIRDNPRTLGTYGVESSLAAIEAALASATASAPRAGADRVAGRPAP